MSISTINTLLIIQEAITEEEEKISSIQVGGKEKDDNDAMKTLSPI